MLWTDQCLHLLYNYEPCYTSLPLAQNLNDNETTFSLHMDIQIVARLGIELQVIMAK